MSLRKLIKLNARRALRGNWSRACAIVLLCFAVLLLFLILEGMLTLALDLPPFIDPAGTPDFALDDLPNPSPLALAVLTALAVLCLMVSAPLELGALRWYYRLGDARVDEVSAVFEYFSSLRLFLCAVWLRINVGVRSAGWTALFLLPAAILGAFSSSAFEAARSDAEGLLAGCGIALSVLLGTASLILALIWCRRYALAPFALADDPGSSARRAVRRSISATKGHRVRLLLLELSMLGWHLLGLLMITRLYTHPYLQTVRGINARYLFECSGRAAPPAQPNENPA